MHRSAIVHSKEIEFSCTAERDLPKSATLQSNLLNYAILINNLYFFIVYVGIFFILFTFLSYLYCVTYYYLRQLFRLIDIYVRLFRLINSSQFDVKVGKLFNLKFVCLHIEKKIGSLYSNVCNAYGYFEQFLKQEINLFHKFWFKV